MKSAEAYPTLERKRAKAAEADHKARGEERAPRKRPQKVEQHFDDCGSELSSLTAGAGDDNSFLVDSHEEEYDAAPAAADFMQAILDPMLDWSCGLIGSGSPLHDEMIDAVMMDAVADLAGV